MGSVEHGLVGDFVGQFSVGHGLVAGDLVDTKVFVEILKVVLLHPAAKDKQDDFFATALCGVAQYGDFDGLAARVGGAHDDALESRVFGPGLVLVAEVVGEQILAVVAGTLMDEFAFGWLALIPAVATVVFFPGDEVQVGMLGEGGEYFRTEDSAIDNDGDGLVLIERKLCAKALNEIYGALAQIEEVVCGLEVDGVTVDAVNEVAVHDFVHASDA